jgi:cell shape-determining protein MreD
VKFFITVALALLMLSVEGVLAKYFGASLVRIDATVAIVAFLALRANTLEGAFSSFVLGYLLDVMSGRATGLYTFLAVFLFLLARMAGSIVQVRSGLSFALFAACCDAVHGLLVLFFSWMVFQNSAPYALSSLAAQTLLTGVAALLLYPLLRKLDPGADRAPAGMLL